MANEDHIIILKEGCEVWNAWRSRNSQITPDLSEATLYDQDLSGFNLSNTDLTRAYLRGASFESANLSRAILLHANLYKTNFQGASLEAAQLDHAICYAADFSEANLQNASMIQLNGKKAAFDEAQLHNVTLTQANLEESNFLEANLSDADMSECRLNRASMLSASLERAQLLRADLSQANLQGANLTEANCSAATLNEVNLSECRITGTILRGAVISDSSLAGATLVDADLADSKQSNIVIFENQNLMLVTQKIQDGLGLLAQIQNKENNGEVLEHQMLVVGNLLPEKRELLNELCALSVDEGNTLTLLQVDEAEILPSEHELISAILGSVSTAIVDITDANHLNELLPGLTPQSDALRLVVCSGSPEFDDKSRAAWTTGNLNPRLISYDTVPELIGLLKPSPTTAAETPVVDPEQTVILEAEQEPSESSTPAQKKKQKGKRKQKPVPKSFIEDIDRLEENFKPEARLSSTPSKEDTRDLGHVKLDLEAETQPEESRPVFNDVHVDVIQEIMQPFKTDEALDSEPAEPPDVVVEAAFDRPAVQPGGRVKSSRGWIYSFGLLAIIALGALMFTMLRKSVLIELSVPVSAVVYIDGKLANTETAVGMTQHRSQSLWIGDHKVEVYSEALTQPESYEFVRFKKQVSTINVAGRGGDNVYRISLDTLYTVTHVADGRIPDIDSSGKNIVYALPGPDWNSQPADKELVIQNLASGTRDIIKLPQTWLYSWEWSRLDLLTESGKIFLTANKPGRKTSELYRIDMASGNARKIPVKSRRLQFVPVDHGEKLIVGNLLYDLDGNQLSVISEEPPLYNRVYGGDNNYLFYFQEKRNSTTGRAVSYCVRTKLGEQNVEELFPMYSRVPPFLSGDGSGTSVIVTQYEGLSLELYSTISMWQDGQQAELVSEIKDGERQYADGVYFHKTEARTDASGHNIIYDYERKIYCIAIPQTITFNDLMNTAP